MTDLTYQAIKVVGSGRITEGVPESVKTAIGEFMVAFAAMEIAAERFIWECTGLSSDDGRLLTRMDARPKLELTKTFSERRAIPPIADPARAKTFWKELKNVADARNTVAHGYWVMLDNDLPVAASFRFKADPGRATGEGFPVDRLARLAAWCHRARDTFDTMTAALSPSQPTP